MLHNLKDITLNLLNSLIECHFITDDNERLLVIKVDGECRLGSEGGIDINKIFFLTVGYFFLLEPSALMFDFRDFKYEWSNTLLKILNFTKIIGRSDEEKNIPMSFVISKNNDVGIASLLGVEVNNLPHSYYTDFKTALTDLENILIG